MTIIQILIAYLVSVTFSLIVAQTPELKMATNKTKVESNPIEKQINVNVLTNVNIPNNKNIIQPKPVKLCLNPNGQLKQLSTTPKPRNKQMPLILSRPRALPVQIPLIIQTQNGKKPLQYIRLNTDIDRQRHLKPKTETNKEIPRKKVTAIDKPKNQKRKNKTKNCKSVEDYINFRSLPPAHLNTRNNNTLESDKELEDLRHGIFNDTKYDVFEIDPESDIDDDDFFKNQTHAILFSEELHPDEHENENEAGNELKCEDKIQKPPVTTVDKTEVPLTPIAEDEVTMMVMKNDGTNSDDESIITINDPIPRQHPIINLDSNNGITDINIKENEFEEFEERSAASYPELMNEDLNQPIPVQSWDNGNLCNLQRLQNYQAACDKYLKLMTKGNFYENDNLYPNANLAQPYPINKADVIQTLSAPESRIIQDIYGPKPDFPNVIDVRPENAIGRIWRTWKGTEVKAKNPKYFGNRPLDLGRNFNDINYGGFAKSPVLYGPQSIGINGYYNNFNNGVPYRYPYPYQCSMI